MKRAAIESDLAQAEIAVAQATANLERQREMLHYATRFGATEIVKLAKMLLGKVEDNLVLKMEIRDRLKGALDAATETEIA